MRYGDAVAVRRNRKFKIFAGSLEIELMVHAKLMEQYIEKVTICISTEIFWQVNGQWLKNDILVAAK